MDDKEFEVMASRVQEMEEMSKEILEALSKSETSRDLAIASGGFLISTYKILSYFRDHSEEAAPLLSAVLEEVEEAFKLLTSFSLKEIVVRREDA